MIRTRTQQKEVEAQLDVVRRDINDLLHSMTEAHQAALLLLERRKLELEDLLADYHALSADSRGRPALVSADTGGVWPTASDALFHVRSIARHTQKSLGVSLGKSQSSMARLEAVDATARTHRTLREWCSSCDYDVLNVLVPKLASHSSSLAIQASLLATVIKYMYRAQSPADTLTAFLRKLALITQADCATCFVLMSDSSRLHLRAHLGIRHTAHVSEFTWKRQVSAQLFWSLSEPTVYAVPDETEPLAMSHFCRREKIAVAVAVPLFDRGGKFGILFLNYRRRILVPTEHVKALSDVGFLVSMLLGVTGRELQERTTDPFVKLWAAVRPLCRTVLQSGPSADTCPPLLQLLVSRAAAPGCRASMYLRRGANLEHVCSVGDGPAFLSPEVVRRVTNPLWRIATGRATTQFRDVFAAHEETPVVTDAPAVGNCVAVPIPKGGEHVAGCIAIATPSQSTFTSELIQTMHEMAQMLGDALYARKTLGAEDSGAKGLAEGAKKLRKWVKAAQAGASTSKMLGELVAFIRWHFDAMVVGVWYVDPTTNCVDSGYSAFSYDSKRLRGRSPKIADVRPRDDGLTRKLIRSETRAPLVIRNPEADKRVNHLIVDCYKAVEGGCLVGAPVCGQVSGRPEAVLWIWFDGSSRIVKGSDDDIAGAAREYAEILDSVLTMIEPTKRAKPRKLGINLSSRS